MSEIQGLPPPDTQPMAAISTPLPTPPSLPSPSKSTPSLSTLKSWLPLYLSRTDTSLTRLSKILSTPSGTDTLLLTLCYSTLLTSSLLSRISLSRLQAQARLIIQKAISLPPNTTVIIDTSTIPVSRTAITAARLKALSVLISDFRIFARLWGLLGIYTWGKGVWASKEEDGLLRGIAYAQVAVNVLFQYLENGAYLSSKNVLGWSKERQNRAWIWSSRWWMAHVALDFVRLGREHALRAAAGRREAKGKGKSVEETGDVKELEDRKWKETWVKQMIVNLAFAPLTAHWSLEQGLVSEFWIGVGGTVAGLAELRSRWRDAGMV